MPSNLSKQKIIELLENVLSALLSPCLLTTVMAYLPAYNCVITQLRAAKVIRVLAYKLQKFLCLNQK
jgi:hypothetical protein